MISKSLVIRHRVFKRPLFLLSSILLVAFPAAAQIDPPRSAPTLPNSTVQPDAQTVAKKDYCPQLYQYAPSAQHITIDTAIGKIQLRGYTVLTEAEITQEANNVIALLKESNLSLEALAEKIVDRITILYSNKGYLTSRIVSETPAVVDGTVRLIAIEAPSSQSITLDSAIGKIQFRGYTVLTDSEITQTVNKVIEPLKASNLGLQAIAEKVADHINLLYINKGYLTSRVAFETPAVVGDKAQLIAIEGYVGAIEVEDRQRLSLAYICDRIQMGITPPIQKQRLEEQLRLLKADPLFNNIEANLKAGTRLGESILNLRIVESRAFNGSLGADNYSPPSVGSERVGGVLSYRNLTGLGDAISTSYYISTTGGSKAFDVNYRAPLNPMNGTMQLRYSASRSKITDPQFSFLDIRANSDLYEINYRQPLVRSISQEFALTLGLSVQDGQTFILNDLPTPFGIGPDPDGNSRTRILRFGQEYVKRDQGGAWGLKSQFSFGLNLFNATSNPAPIPDGSFFSWLGQVQRIQRINNDNLLIAQADVQLTPDSLLPAQQYILGGGQSVRGFRQNARSGDNGFRFSLEDRIAIQRDKNGLPILQLAPFFDIGKVWNKSSNPNKLPDQNFLAGIGLGVIFEPTPGLVIRLDYAAPLVDLSDRGNNAQDKGFYFSVGITP